jgi:hypothetical protein
VITAPLAGAPEVSVTWPLPDSLPFIEGGTDTEAKATFVSANVLESPKALAVRLYTPAVPLAVAVMLAMPLEPVTALDSESVALAPDTGAMKSTVAPLSGALQGSVKVTVKGVAKAVFTTADCGEPAVVASFDPVVFRLTSLIANHPGELPKLESV